MKRIPLLLPPDMLAWLDAKTRGVENRNTFIRRLIAEAMKHDQEAR
jgi:metal-responsive CopG/Arc/MetJ family transcriptional regulator